MSETLNDRPEELDPPPNSLLGVMLSLNREWSFTDWFEWPPDLFALTSLLLKTTGAYRFAIAPPHPWPQKDWERQVIQAAEGWWEWITGETSSLPPLVRDNQALLDKHKRTIEIEHLRSLQGEGDNDIDRRSWEVCRALLELHAIADQACQGFGLPQAEAKPHRSAVSYLANMLLISTGTLSRLPSFKAIVLPKMRTPQVGLTLRSLSHHVTVHQSEVEVVWRTMPWLNSDEDTLNVMLVPWPRRMKQTWFKPQRHSVNRESSEPARYFTLRRGDEEALDVDGVVAMIKHSASQINRVHLLVFPELALKQSELDDLKAALTGELDRNSMPMILTGLREESTGTKLGRNKVILSTFFSGKWYDLIQDKHHRWKLDAAQIQQYNLGGVLS
ncbi:MAG TPA: hypothetical protein VMM92_00810, partial [Thermoanaerobaculia bacterium]|nr:hypothetical protein [Thermoanaerobaculia bacterium]